MLFLIQAPEQGNGYLRLAPLCPRLTQYQPIGMNQISSRFPPTGPDGATFRVRGAIGIGTPCRLRALSEPRSLEFRGFFVPRYKPEVSRNKKRKNGKGIFMQ